MDSLLTRERPDLWRRTVALATRLTGYQYVPKLPLPDGTIYACGGGNYDEPEDPFVHEPDPRKHLRKLREKLKREERDGSTNYYPSQWQRWIDRILERTPISDAEQIRRRKEIEKIDSEIKERRDKIEQRRGEIEELEQEIEDLERKKSGQVASCAQPRVFVPEGAMEWILHEVGHWIAASPEERLLPNYGLTPSEIGHDGDREWEAWAFEEIILAPFGPSRLFAPPTQRDGAAFAKAGPMPWFALRHAERRMLEMSVDVEEWRALYCEWIKFERGKPTPSWERVS